MAELEWTTKHLTHRPLVTLDRGGRHTPHVSVGVDPMVSVTMSVIATFGPTVTTPAAFATRVAGLRRRYKPNLKGLEVLLCASPTGFVPDFLGVAEVRPGIRTFEEELEKLLATDTQRIDATLGDAVGDAPMPDAYREWADRPKAALERYVGALRRYERDIFRRALPRYQDRLTRSARHWAAFHSLGDVDQTLEALGRWHPTIEFLDGMLTVPAPIDDDAEPPADGLVLVPMIGSHTGYWCGESSNPADRRPFLGMALPGLVLSDRLLRPPSTPDPLSGLLGTTRATLVRRLGRETTTTQLAEYLGLAPSTVSHHLSRLVAADIATSRRAKNEVLYVLSDRGYELLSIYDQLI